MSISSRKSIRRACLLGCVLGAAALLSIAVGQASAASYPAGGGTFTGGLEGWQVKEATCNVPLLCEGSGGYDAAAGNPPGSLVARSKIRLNPLGVFKATVVEESPDFIAGGDGAAQLSLQHQLTSTEPVALTPKLAYTAVLVDKTAGTEQKAIEESVEGSSGFASKEGTVTLASGHTYAIKVTSEIDSSVVALGSNGEAAANYDNVVLTDSSTGTGTGPGGSGSGGGGSSGGEGANGAAGLTSSQLSSLIQSQGLVGSATLKGNRIFVKAKCPAKVGRACKVSVQGMLKKGKAATTVRTAKIPKGKAKRLVLKVKPKFKSKVMKKKKLLFKVTVKAGTAKATVYKRLKLIKR